MAMPDDAPVQEQAVRAPRILFLFSSYAHYWGGLIKAIASVRPGTDIVVVHRDWPKSGQVTHEIPPDVPARFVRRSSVTRRGLMQMLQADRPDIIYISGWVDREYLACARAYRFANPKVAVVCGIDDQWKGSVRQRLGVVYFGLFYRSVFNFMWVSGKPQYHYAERFGYDHTNIISNLLSADSTKFTSPAAVSRRFVFVGRFIRVKGLDLLLRAYLSLPEGIRREWSLDLIGEGPELAEIQAMCKGESGIRIKPFMNQPDLLRELMGGGVCCMPSRFEPWGVAIHEMALLGYPLILSSACGAATEFLVSGCNGFLFRSEEVGSLRNALLRIASCPEDTLQEFGFRSVALGRRISSEMSAHSLLSTQYLVGM
jgi:glycosyltransferase involved in cell wall biosynthesis